MHIKPLVGALALIGFATLSHANPEIDALRAEIAQMKRQYEARLAELEAKLRAAEGRAASTSASDRLGAVTAGSAFNPQISVILDGVYYRDNKKGKGPKLYEHLGGFNHSHGKHDEHSHGEHDEHGIERGFNLRPTELVFSATVDPWFDANLMLTVDSEGGVELEQAYFDTRSLPAGLKLRGGKFFSGIGYLNDKHPHQWDFVDQNLPYRTLLGEHGLVDTGLQLTWRPKTGSLYTLLGVEALQGNKQVFADVVDEKERTEYKLAGKKAGPRLWTGFAKFAPSLANNHALQLGVWGARASQHQEIHVHDDEDHALEGKSRLWGLDAVYKYDAPGAYGAGDFSLSAEYLRVVKDLKVASSDEDGQPRKFTQDGFYIQGVYGFAPRWQLGLRYDVTGLTNKLDKGSEVERWDDSRRWSLALTHHFSEFSRLRLQLGRANLYVEDKDKYKRERVNEIWLQYQHSLGAHGAHKF